MWPPRVGARTSAGGVLPSGRGVWASTALALAGEEMPGGRTVALLPLAVCAAAATTHINKGTHIACIVPG